MITRVAFLLAALVMAAAGTAIGDPPAPLEVTLSRGVTQLSGSEYLYDCGRIDPFAQKSVQARFSARNETGTLVSVTAVQPSCSCTTARLTRSARDSRLELRMPAAIGPGQPFVVEVSVDLADIPAGMMMKSVAVFVAGRADPALELVVRGDVAPAVTFSPTLADFGNVRAGAGRSLEITASLDSRAAALGAPDLASSSPYVHVVREVSDRPAGGPSASRAAKPAGAPALVERRYAVSVDRNAPIGTIFANLTFAPGSAAIPGLAGLVVPVIGQVTGEVAAEPRQVGFGRVDSRVPYAMRIILTGETTLALQGLTMTTDSPLLSASLAPAATAAPPFRILTIRLRAGAPAGIFRSNVWVTLAGGTRLTIPVTAFVMQP
jgi:hypothetical protein